MAIGPVNPIQVNTIFSISEIACSIRFIFISIMETAKKNTKNVLVMALGTKLVSSEGLHKSFMSFFLLNLVKGKEGYCFKTIFISKKVEASLI